MLTGGIDAHGGEKGGVFRGEGGEGVLQYVASYFGVVCMMSRRKLAASVAAASDFWALPLIRPIARES
jgi:hypothetical protein